MKKIIVGIVFSFLFCIGVSHGMMNARGNGNGGNNNGNQTQNRFVPEDRVRDQIEAAIFAGNQNALNDIIYDSGLDDEEQEAMIEYIVDEYNM